MLTHQQIDILESAWQILDSLRNSQDFNESHDLTISDGCRVILTFLTIRTIRSVQPATRSLQSYLLHILNRSIISKSERLQRLSPLAVAL